jgi:hypothetical protein
MCKTRMDGEPHGSLFTFTTTVKVPLVDTYLGRPLRSVAISCRRAQAVSPLRSSRQLMPAVVRLITTLTQTVPIRSRVTPTLACTYKSVTTS